MRGSPSQGPPVFGQRPHVLDGWAYAQPKSHANAFLQGEITCRPSIAVTQTEQQIDVGGPWSHAMQGGQQVVGFIRVSFAERIQVETLFNYLSRYKLECLDFGSREPEPSKFIRPRTQQSILVKWLEGRRHARPDCCCARRRQLLSHNDRR